MRLRATRLFSIGNPNGFRGPVPALDLDFLAMTAVNTLDPRITYTRAGNATYFDSAGAMQTVGANVPRLDYDPITLQPRGFLLEPAVTNSLLNSATLATQSVTVTAAARTLSFYGTGTVVLSGAFSATVVGTGAFPTRTELTFTPTAGTLTLTVTGTVQYANLELGTRPTSWIPTTGAAVTRQADVANMTGTNFSAWYNQTEGVFVVDCALVNPSATGAAGRVLVTSSGGTANRVTDLQYNTTSWANFNGTTNINAPGAPGNFAVNKVAGAYKSGDYGICQNGLTPVSATTALVNTPNQLAIGHLNSGNQPIGWIRRIRYYNTRLSNAEMQTLTAP